MTAVRKVLREVGHPLHYSEITEIAEVRVPEQRRADAAER
jgi:hypothetical protein